MSIEISIPITKITVVKGAGMDQCVIDTEMPGSVHPRTIPAAFLLYAAYDEGESYCRANFPGVPITVVGRV